MFRGKVRVFVRRRLVLLGGGNGGGNWQVLERGTREEKLVHLFIYTEKQAQKCKIKPIILTSPDAGRPSVPPYWGGEIPSRFSGRFSRLANPHLNLALSLSSLLLLHLHFSCVESDERCLNSMARFLLFETQLGRASQSKEADGKWSRFPANYKPSQPSLQVLMRRSSPLVSHHAREVIRGLEEVTKKADGWKVPQPQNGQILLPTFNINLVDMFSTFRNARHSSVLPFLVTCTPREPYGQFLSPPLLPRLITMPGSPRPKSMTHNSIHP